MIDILPEDIIRKIFEYDRTYIEVYNNALIEMLSKLEYKRNLHLCIICSNIYYDNMNCYHCGNSVCTNCKTICSSCDCKVCENCVFDM